MSPVKQSLICISACEGPNGEIYKEGQSFKIDCNGCTCRSNGIAICTLRVCPKKCIYYGKKYSPGDKFQAKDGCNECTCSKDGDGTISCTKYACGYGK